MKQHIKNNWIIYVIINIILLSWFSSPRNRLRFVASFGNSKSMYYLARDYYKMGPAENVPKGDYWMRRSANKGNKDAMWELFNRFQSSRSEEAVYWLRKRADLNDFMALSELGKGYEYGMYGLPKNDAEAKNYYLKAQVAYDASRNKK
ncbi:MAG: sel1 repeat family protein [Holophagaceae bacterium]|nr:sel1 repeat family protein [Holophagaceae bacterium]